MPQIGTETRPFLLTRVSGPRVIRAIVAPGAGTLEIVETEGNNGRRAPTAELLMWPDEVRVDGASQHNFYAGVDPRPIGIFVATRRAARIDERVIIRFTVPNRAAAIVAHCRTDWIREDGPCTVSMLPGIGFQFCDIAEDALRDVGAFTRCRAPLFWE